MKLVALLTEPSSIARFLTALGEPTDVSGRSPSADAAAAVLQEHRPAPQGARGRRVAARTSRARPTPGGRRAPAARQCAPLRARRRARPTLSTHERRVATLAVPPLRFAAPHFFAQRSGFFYLRAEVKEARVGERRVTEGEGFLMPRMSVDFAALSDDETRVEWRMVSRNQRWWVRWLALPPCAA
ncbi:hypothetical protein [Sorangium cellulosum]|nr:hypothetical protein [Sorangium cellulosum]